MRAAVSDTKLKLVKSGIGEAIPVTPIPGGVKADFLNSVFAEDFIELVEQVVNLITAPAMPCYSENREVLADLCGCYAGGGHISPLRTIIACAILTAEKLLENTSGTNMAN